MDKNVSERKDDAGQSAASQPAGRETNTASKDAGSNGPDNLSVQELQQDGSVGYKYLDQTRTVPGAEAAPYPPSSVLNPGYYPKNTKPEALHTEGEKAGADFPMGPVPGDVEDQSRKGEDMPGVKEEQEATKRALQDQLKALGG